MSLFADILALIASVVLTIPAMKFSNYLEKVDRLRKRILEEGFTEGTRKAGQTIFKGMEENANKNIWNKTDHNWLRIGFYSLILAFALKVISQLF